MVTALSVRLNWICRRQCRMPLVKSDPILLTGARVELVAAGIVIAAA
jgi:hypothetical protein